jgi:hypothetical protein
MVRIDKTPDFMYKEKLELAPAGRQMPDGLTIPVAATVSLLQLKIFAKLTP